MDISRKINESVINEKKQAYAEDSEIRGSTDSRHMMTGSQKMK